MSSEPTPQIAPELIWRFLDDNAVIVSPQAGKVQVLNGVGAVIWKLLVEQNDAAKIEDYLITHYDVAREQAHQDLQAFLDELTARGMLLR